MLVITQCVRCVSVIELLEMEIQGLSERILTVWIRSALDCDVY